jgi:raffinose/stachyose/melibiose transport system substrate-binding protein
MNRHRLKLVAVATVTTLAVVISGCSASVGAGKKTLQLWFWGAPPQQQQTMKDVLVDGFNNSQNQYTLEVTFNNAVD